MSCWVTYGEINEFVDKFVVENGIKGYSSLEVISYIYKILFSGYGIHQWQYNDFAVYTLLRICYAAFNEVGFDIEEIFYFYLKRDMKSNIMVSLSNVNEIDTYIRSSVVSYVDLINRCINNLEIIMLSEYQYDCRVDSYNKYRISAYLASEMVRHFYQRFISGNIDRILRYIITVLGLYYKLYKDIGKIKEYYLFSCEGQIEREIKLSCEGVDLLLMCSNIFYKINYLDLFTDFKMQDNGRIEAVNNQCFYQRWCDLSSL